MELHFTRSAKSRQSRLLYCYDHWDKEFHLWGFRESGGLASTLWRSYYKRLQLPKWDFNTSDLLDLSPRIWGPNRVDNRSPSETSSTRATWRRHCIRETYHWTARSQRKRHTYRGLQQGHHKTQRWGWWPTKNIESDVVHGDCQQRLRPKRCHKPLSHRCSSLDRSRRRQIDL